MLAYPGRVKFKTEAFLCTMKPWLDLCSISCCLRARIQRWRRARIRSHLFVYLLPKRNCEDAVAEPGLIACCFFFAMVWVAFEIPCSLWRRAVPDDVAERLSAVYLLVCRSQHSVLEFGGPTLFDVPSSSTSKYNQPVNQSWQPWG